MFMIRSRAQATPSRPFIKPGPCDRCAGPAIRVLVVPKLSTRETRINPTRAAKKSMLACGCSEIGGESNPFGRTARVPDFPDPPVRPPRVEGAYVADRRRPLPARRNRPPRICVPHRMPVIL